VNAVRIESQMQLARTIVEERQLKEIAMQQALAQARAELHDKFSSVIDPDDKATAYSVWSASTQRDDMDDMIEDGHDPPVDK